MQKKRLLLTAIFSALVLGGLAFGFSSTSLFKGQLDGSMMSDDNAPYAGTPNVDMRTGEVATAIDGMIVDGGKGDDPVNPTTIDMPSHISPPDNPGDVTGPRLPTPPRITCGTIQVSVQDQAGNFIRNLTEQNVTVMDEQQNEIQYAFEDCPLPVEEYAPNFYQVNLPVGQEYYLAFGTENHVMQVTDQSAMPMEDARLAETLQLTLPYSFIVNLESTDGVALTGDAHVEANSQTCVHLAPAFAPAQNSYGCPVSMYDQDISYNVALSGYDPLEATVSNPRNSFWDPSFTVTARLAGGRPLAYVEVLDENDADIPNLDESNFSLESGLINSVVELPTGLYQLELEEVGQNKLATVSVDTYEDLTQSIRAWNTPTEAQNNVYVFSLNKKNAQDRKVCDSVNLESSLTAIKASEAPKTVTLTITGTSKTETSLLSIVPNWLAQAFHFEGPEAILASEESWTGVLHLSTTGSGNFSENDLLVDGDTYSKTLTYTASGGDEVTAKIIGEDCEDSITFTTEAEAEAEAEAAAPTPEPAPTQAAPEPAPTPTSPTLQSAYLVIEVLNESKDVVKNLDESDFKLTGPDTSADDFNEIDDGLYEFKLTEGEYDFTLTATGYAKGSLSNADTYSTRSSAEQNNYTINLKKLNLLSDTDYKCTNHFKDITDDLICRLRDAGIIQGTGGGYFGLSTITEAEALKTMLGSRGYDEADGRALPAVPRSVVGYETGWYDAWYRIAVSQNIIRDFADPNHPIPRERYAVLAARTWKKELRGFDASDIPFEDVSTRDPFAYAVLLMNQTEVDVPGEGKTPIIEGYADGTFRPNSLISRKDAMYLLYRALLAWENELPLETKGLSF